MNNVVLDASALLTLLNGETGAEHVAEVIPGAVINTVNLSEVVAKLADYHMPKELIHEAIDMLELHVVPFDEELAYHSGLLRPVTKEKGLSLGDRACLATGLLLELPVMTSDAIWQELNIPLDIYMIR